MILQTLEGISDIRDESDRSGMRIVIEVQNFLLYISQRMDLSYTHQCNTEFHSCHYFS